MSVYATAGANVGYCNLQVVPGYPLGVRTWAFVDGAEAPDEARVDIENASFPCTTNENVVTLEIDADLSAFVNFDWTMVDVATGLPIISGKVVRWADGSTATPTQATVTIDSGGGVIVRSTGGPKGDKGDDGDQGDPGPSAYEDYQDRGGLLPFDDWIESLAGVTGLGTAAERDMLTERGPLALHASDSFGTAPFGTLTGRAFDNELGGDGDVTWAAPVGSGSWRAVALGSEGSSTGPPGNARRDTGGSGTVFHGFDLGVSDGRIEARWTVSGGSTFLLVGRYTADEFYAVRLTVSTLTVDLVRRSAGTTTAISGGHSVAVGDELALNLDGDQIGLAVNGTTVETVTDSTVTSGTLWGFRDSSGNTTFAWGDLWAYRYTTVPVDGPVPNTTYVDDAIVDALADIPAAPTSTVDRLTGTFDPVVTEADGNPTVVGSAVTYGAVYWPSLVRFADHLTAEELDTLGLREWGVYYSTDHESAGGIALLTTDDLAAGPWIDLGQRYRDTEDGNSTETPSVIYVAGDTHPWWLFHQQQGVSSAVGPQSTLLVRSTTPLFGAPGPNVVRVGVVLDLPNLTEFPGGGHTGYFRPSRIGNQWFGYSLLGAGSPSGFSRGLKWHSVDGVTWTPDPRTLGPQADLFDDGFRVAWSGARVIRCRDQLWWFGRVASGPGGGPGGGAVKHVAIAPMAANLRHLLAPPRVLVSGDDEAGWVGADIRSVDVAVHDGRLHIVFGDGGDLGYATSEVL